MALTVQEMMDALRAENVYTWFDLGLFIDRFKENRLVPSAQFSGSFADFKRTIAGGGAAFITYEFGDDEISLGEYVEKHDINLLYLFDVCSRPGNVSLSLATVFLRILEPTHRISQPRLLLG